MKNETARREIESLDYYLQNRTDDYSEESHTAMMMAIKALEQQPTHGSTYGGVSWGGTYKEEAQPTVAKETIIKSTLKYLVKRQIEEGSVGFAVDNDHDHDCCWDDVLAWIEAQPSEDCISRQAVIILIDEASEMHPYKVVGDSDTYSNYNQGWSDACDWLYANIEGVPSVTPKYSDEEIDKAQAVEQAYVDKMVELAVKETERPKGKWIKIEYDVCTFIYKCSKCGMRVVNPYKYCPNCGAEMSGGGEE